VIKKVEEFGAQLQAKSLAKFRGLGDREIRVIERGSDYHVSAQAAKARDRCKYRSVKPRVNRTKDIDGTIDIGPESARNAVNRAVGRDNIESIAALGLHDRGQLPSVDQTIVVKWQVVYGADDEAVTRVKIESEQARCFFLGPMPGGSMDGSTMN